VVSTGVGVVALLAGTGAWGVAKVLEISLNRKCRVAGDRTCGPEEHADLDTYNSVRSLSYAGLIGGAALTAAGLGLVIFGPDPPAEGPEIRAFVGPTWAGVQGTF
jgi:hypothetical protein